MTARIRIVLGEGARMPTRATPGSAGLESRFWSKVAVGSPEQCWLWTACTDVQGYGRFMVGSRKDRSARPELSSRQAWALVHGPIPADLVVRHKCDNPPCCNPAHLELGTRAQNNRDMVERGRSCRGEARPESKLTSAQVREIRAKYASGDRTQASLAAEYGVCRAHVGDIVRGKLWAHVKEGVE